MNAYHSTSRIRFAKLLRLGWKSCFGGHRLSVLAYHRIADDPSDELAVRPAVFADQMQWLRDQGYQVTPLSRALQRLNRQENLQGLIAITFDDGYIDFIEQAYPVLERHGFPTTLFVVTGKLGRRSDWNRVSPPSQLLSLEQLRMLPRTRYAMGSHSESHLLLTTLSDAELEQELRGSQTLLQDELGVHEFYFAYPFGAFNQREKRAVYGTGYVCAFGIGNFCMNEYWTERFSLQRGEIRRKHTLRDFAAMVSPGLGYRLRQYWRGASR